MRLQLLCVSKRPAAWVSEACHEYLKRLQGKLEFQVRELAPVQNVANADQQRRREGLLIRKALPSGARMIALDERGAAWSTQELSAHLASWRETQQEVALIIGGAEGLADSIRETAAQVWSLSRLTLPHQLARVVVIEQIYRAWSLLNQHPYHRA
jgi:23S rRNA (pseudouridine1915-N3)-methyltransferase